MSSRRQHAVAHADGEALPGPLDTLSRAILRILAREPRAAFADLGTRLGVHERTVARRLDRMLEASLVRFTAELVPEYLGEGLVAALAVRCLPSRLHEVAIVLAQRPDTRSVDVATGSPEVHVELWVRDHELLLPAAYGSVGRIDGVVDVRTAVVLQLLLTANDWSPDGDGVTPIRQFTMEGRPFPAPLRVDDLDRRLVSLLAVDARMSITRLARELSVGETTARRRLARLMGSHVLHLRLHVEPRVLGFPVEGRFALAVPHRGLDDAVRRLACEPAVRYLAITTGHTNVLGYSSHRSVRDLSQFTTAVLADLDSVSSAATAMVMHSYKRIHLLDTSTLA